METEATAANDDGTAAKLIRLARTNINGWKRRMMTSVEFQFPLLLPSVLRNVRLRMQLHFDLSVNPAA